MLILFALVDICSAHLFVYVLSHCFISPCSSSSSSFFHSVHFASLFDSRSPLSFLHLPIFFASVCPALSLGQVLCVG